MQNLAQTLFLSSLTLSITVYANQGPLSHSIHLFTSKTCQPIAIAKLGVTIEKRKVWWFSSTQWLITTESIIRAYFAFRVKQLSIFKINWVFVDSTKVVSGCFSLKTWFVGALTYWSWFRGGADLYKHSYPIATAASSLIARWTFDSKLSCIAAIHLFDHLISDVILLESSFVITDAAVGVVVFCRQTTWNLSGPMTKPHADNYYRLVSTDSRP